MKLRDFDIDTIEDTDAQIKMAKERTLLSIERNRLANEQTFLSWIRTGLAGVGGGIAVIRLLTFQHEAHQIMAESVGMLLVFWGMSIFILAMIDYRRSYRILKTKNGYIGSIPAITTMSVSLFVLSLVLLFALLHGHST